MSLGPQCMCAETGQPAERLRRDVVASQLNIPIPETTIPGHASSGSEMCVHVLSLARMQGAKLLRDPDP
eukprot:scaffold259619_cov41-Tisochrysis_lutea.AAC.3